MDVTASRRPADKALAFAARADGLSLPPTLRIGPWRGVGWFRASKAGGMLAAWPAAANDRHIASPDCPRRRTISLTMCNRRASRESAQTEPSAILVTDDWPDVVPISDVELRVMEAHFADVLGGILGPKA